ncbi:MAG: hypothetical protein ACH37Z_06505 [Anaerolineae bacterium]|jgi:hypothetical protein|nr:hypothetical protein [Ardenticatenia bacterium]MBK8540045.1 hypothetical protein [Ardenticatenia bacterium]HQZ70139.1 hypothetical protein [Anaerolineae bacterium]HRA20341.1 hypothetical protein [Anaerolineae bacterium]
MNEQLLIDFAGAYGGPTSRDQLLRVLKEALALIEQAPPRAEFRCAGLRIECRWVEDAPDT